MTRKNDDTLSAKQVFTTGEAAKVCNVSQQTIIRCFDSGRLQGFKVPGSRFRRIPRAELVRFMHTNNIPLERLEEGPVRVLVVGVAAGAVDSVITTHAVDREVEIRHAEDAWEAGFMAHEFRPSLILVDPAIPGLDEHAIRARLESDPEGCAARVVAIRREAADMHGGTGNGEGVLERAVRELLSA